MNNLKNDEKLICVKVLTYQEKRTAVNKAISNIFQKPMFDYEIDLFLSELKAYNIGLVKWSGKLAEVSLNAKLNANKTQLKIEL